MIFLPVSGQYSLMLFKDRPKSEGASDPRYPVGPMIAQFGSYTVDEDAKRLKYQHWTIPRRQRSLEWNVVSPSK